MSRGSQSHCRPKLCLSLAGELVLPGWLQLFAGRQALPAKILAYLGTNTCLRRPNRYPGHWPMGFPESRGPGNPNCLAHCAGPGNGSSRHSVMDLCEYIPGINAVHQVWDPWRVGEGNVMIFLPFNCARFPHDGLLFHSILIPPLWSIPQYVLPPCLLLLHVYHLHFDACISYMLLTCFFLLTYYMPCKHGLFVCKLICRLSLFFS